MLARFLDLRCLLVSSVCLTLPPFAVGANGGLAAAEPSAEAADRVRSLVTRMEKLFQGPEGAKLTRVEKIGDEEKRVSLPLNKKFREAAPGVFETRENLVIVITKASGRAATLTLALTSRLSLDPGDPTRILLTETSTTPDGRVVEESVLVEPKGDIAFVTRVRDADLPGLKKGAWVSCEWTRSSDGEVLGVRRYKDVDHLVLWRQQP